MHKFGCKKGFTLVEVSIVLIIIGIILTTIVKGGEILRSARIKSLLLTQNDLHQAALAYREKFGYLPGDDPLAVTHVGASVNGNGNSRIDAGESALALNHLQLAGLISGSYNGTTDTLKHNFGSGDVSFRNYSFSAPSGGGLKISIPAVMYTTIPYDVAQALETALDGPDYPDSHKGSVQAPPGVPDSNDYMSASNSKNLFPVYCALYPVAP